MRALLSVYDKRGLSEFAAGLVELGWELISTGGTMRSLVDAGLPVLAVSDVTGFPEMLDGRVKTLHPAIHGGILARRDLPDHLRQLESHDIQPIDMVVSNLYPFAETVRSPDVTEIDAIEQIDIGGPTLIRASAKNYAGVLILTDPDDYQPVLVALREGGFDQAGRKALAAKAFAHVSAYDAVVAGYLRNDNGSDDPFPLEFSLAGRRAHDLRYGENPHQRASAYRRSEPGPERTGILDAVQLGGQELSFNNILDADAAWLAAWTFAAPTVAIVKHTIPCGLASRATVPDAFEAALAGDPVSAFGGIVALNRPLDGKTAARLTDTLFDIVIAPSFHPEALEQLTTKQRLRILQLDGPGSSGTGTPWDVRLVTGGFLLQDADVSPDDFASWQVVTERAPSEEEWRDLRFAWLASRHVKSNAIVIVKDEAIVGVGAGQPNRLESVGIAARRAGESAVGAALASDAFFPFPDGVEAAAAAGVSAIAQPGGAMRDKRVIAAANTSGVAMVFTGTRHFRH